jgi:alginate O-acetyltransferase complex protein AlgI
VFFQTTNFLLFFCVLYTLFFIFHKFKSATLFILTLGSLFFYATFGAKYIFILIGISLFDFTTGLLIHNAESKLFRKLLLFFSISLNMSLLIYFKYHLFNEIIEDSFQNIIGLVIPFGISFYTYESMSYTIDIFRKEIVPQKNFIEYLFFISFFPHLISGPIIRPKEFFKNISGDFFCTQSNFKRGSFRFLTGLIKKVLFADLIGQFWIDQIFRNPASYHGIDICLSLIGFGTKLYFDLSGYTDMAVGISLTFGIILPENFRSPGLASNVQQFWRRWHMSLSFWFRDYVYIPLNKDGKSIARSYIASLFTLSLVGLWHGANIPQIAWGILQGILLVASRILGAISSKFTPLKKIPVFITSLITYLLMCASTGFYVFHKTSQTLYFYKQAFFSGWSSAIPIKTPVWGIFLVILCLILQRLSQLGYKKKIENYIANSRFYIFAPIIVLTIVIIYFTEENVQSFMYFTY